MTALYRQNSEQYIVNSAHKHPTPTVIFNAVRLKLWCRFHYGFRLGAINDFPFYKGAYSLVKGSERSCYTIPLLFSFPDLSSVSVHGDMEVKISLVTEPEDERTDRELNRFIERESLVVRDYEALRGLVWSFSAPF